ncbi:MAG: S41 family peptidase [Helicobacteraceae bacterium]|jgi:carboxyl-terminal processing protease|nr:S41 family peptidase [Helicobacteraceae bacterium]
MKQRLIALVSFAFILSVAFGFYTTLEAKNENAYSDRRKAIDKFLKVVDIVEKYYVDPIDIDTALQKAMDGMLSNLDAHSGYIEGKQYQEMNIKMQGEFGGLGITVSMRDGALTVESPIEGTPADAAGIESGDIILKIDDKSTIGMNIDDAVGLMRGKPGTKVTLTIIRKGRERPFEAPIVRAIIKVQSVYAKTYGDDVLYLRIVSFDKNVAASLKREINARKGEFKGIILDLRNNAGGLMDQAVEATDIFVDKGVIVSQKGRVESENRVITASKNGTLTNIPMVVLVNGGSASASEIVAGSLQDHRRAVIVGEKTFGKGSVQVVMPLRDTGESDAIRLTIARYYLPSGRSIQAMGIVPDVEVKRISFKEIESEYEVKESQLKGHLEAQLNAANGTTGEEKPKADPNVIAETQLNNDYQLKTALGILRGLIVLKK